MEIILTLILLFVVVVIIPYYVLHYYFKRGRINYINAIHIQGIKGLENLKDVMIFIYENKLTINDIQTIPFERIKKTSIKKEIKMVEKEKSVIGRGIIGGLLFGPIGAVVGGLSGTGSTKVKEDKNYFIIDFININNQDDIAIFLINNFMLKQLSNIVNFINEKVGYIDNIKNNISYEI